LRKPIPRPEVLHFTRNKLCHQNGEIFKKNSKNVSTPTVVVSCDPLCPTPTSSAIKSPANTAEEPDDPEPTAKGDT